MRVANVARWLAITLLTLLFALAGARADEFSDIKKKIDEIVIPSIGISDETVALARRFVSLNRERFGAQSNEYADALNVLGKYLHLQGRLDEAEAIFREEFGIRRQTYAERPLDAIAEEADRLAALNAISRAFPLALGYADEVKARSGERSPEFAAALHRLAQLHIWSTSYARADELCRSALAMREAALPADHADIASSLGLLIEILRVRKSNSAAEIEAPQSRLVQLWYSRAIGPQATAQDRMMFEIWSSYHSAYLGAAGRWSEAAGTDLRSLDVQRTYKKESELLHAILWTAQGLILAGMTGEGEKLYREAISLGEASPQNVRDELVAAELVTATVFVAEQIAGRGDLDAAVKLFEHQFAVFEGASGSDFDVATELLRAQARWLTKRGQYGEAERLYLAGLGRLQRLDSPPEPSENLGRRAEVEQELADLYRAEDRHGEANAILTRLLSTAPDRTGDILPSPPSLDPSPWLEGLAILAMERGDWREAADHLRHLMNLDIGWRGAANAPKRSIDTARLDSSESWQKSRADDLETRGLAEKVASLKTAGDILRAYIRSVHHAGTAETPDSAETFTMAQFAEYSAAANAMQQMALRFAQGDDDTARLMRERQDLGGTIERLSKPVLIGWRETDEGVLRSQQRQLDASLARLSEIDDELRRSAPRLAEFLSPQPVAMADLQARLFPDDALILIIHLPRVGRLPDETILWVVTAREHRRLSIPIGTAEIETIVNKLRCGLDRDSNWRRSASTRRWLARNPVCAALKPDGFNEREGPPFDLALAHELYRELFGPVADLIKDKSLLIVPSGPLTKLPFQVLLTEPPASAASPASGDYAAAAWLIKSHSTAVLPSVASLDALRRHAKPSRASGPFAGFGNPLLLGKYGSDRRAWDRQSCGLAPETNLVEVAERGVVDEIQEFFRGELADLALLRRQQPLPETADELCSVARDLGAPEDDVHLGAKATEAEVKGMSRRGALAAHRIIHFATHGLVAGESESIAKARAEPALLLTPPDTATKEDDGLLTASEVAELKLDADWVVLSACNTAAGGDKSNAESLSGLARAFIYAGSRALLVSHWYVDSRAAVKVTTGAFAEVRRDPSLGRAEALRRSMLATMNDAGRPSHWTPAAHPAIWAPFVLVGEGGTAGP